MKTQIEIEKESKGIKLIPKGIMSITETHSFVKDLMGKIYDFHKMFPEEKIGNYIGD